MFRRMAPPLAVWGGVCGVAAVAWQAVRWIDVDDSTCGPAYRPDIWTDLPACQDLMTNRLILLGIVLVASLALIILGTRALLREPSLNDDGAGSHAPPE